MQRWKDGWRKGFEPILSNEGLEALRIALLSDDKRLIQGGTTKPQFIACDKNDQSIEGACAIGFCGWQGHGLQTIRDVKKYFSECCRKVQSKSETCWGSFIGWFDDTPREEMRTKLLAEVELALEKRKQVKA